MEIQCKERVDLLEALRQSRAEANQSTARSSNGTARLEKASLPKTPRDSIEQEDMGWIGQGTIPPLSFPDLPRPGPPLPQRPPILQRRTSESRSYRSHSVPQSQNPSPILPYSSPVVTNQTSRTPSPEKKSRMLTTLRPNKDGKRPSKSLRTSGARRSGPPVPLQAAGLAWDSISRGSGQRLGQELAAHGGSTTSVNTLQRDVQSRSESAGAVSRERTSSFIGSHGPLDSMSNQESARPNSSSAGQMIVPSQDFGGISNVVQSQTFEDLISLEPPTPPQHDTETNPPLITKTRTKSPARPKSQVDYLSYRNEYLKAPPKSKVTTQPLSPASSRYSESTSPLPIRQRSPQRKTRPPVPTRISRRPVEQVSSPQSARQDRGSLGKARSSDSADEHTSSSREAPNGPARSPRKSRKDPVPTKEPTTPPLTDKDSSEETALDKACEKRIKHVQKHLPKGVDENAAKQIFNEIVVKGDEVHWDDVAGLDVAKNALKEAVVYPFLRPDLFMGLREPARGMLLFGPPGTGKTMLARAVATESRSTFFAISASSLTSKFLGESEKLVRALFSLAKALAPSIIFVDEIDSLLSSRGGSSEHESTRRIKTEFLIQWSDLQRAAAGKVQTDKEKLEGDASRVLVLAATNMPWAIDEAARRRFVRRQYIPLPEGIVRATQLKTLLGHQKHSLNSQDIQVLVELTDGTSPSLLFFFARRAPVTNLPH